MSDIKKGYTFTDKSTDWASNKDTAIRLNKMMDEAEVNLLAGSNITISRGLDGITINAATGGGSTNTILNGSGAPSSGLGNNGDFYIDTTANAIYGPKTSGSWGSPTSIVGTNGTNGTNGSVWYTGSGVPSAGLGVNIDFYLRTTNGDVYSKASGSWVVTQNLTGPAGSSSAPVGVANRAALRAYTGAVDKQFIVEAAYGGTPGDGGGGLWQFVASDNYSVDNDGTLVVPGGVYTTPATAGCWHRVGVGTQGLSVVTGTKLDVRWFGAIPNKGTDCAAPFVRAFNSLKVLSSKLDGAIYAPAGYYAFYNNMLFDATGLDIKTAFIGDGPSATVFYNSLTTSGLSYFMKFVGFDNLTLSGFTVQKITITPPTYNPDAIIHIKNGQSVHVNNVDGRDNVGTSFLWEATEGGTWLQMAGCKTYGTSNVGTQLKCLGGAGTVTGCSFKTSYSTPCLWINSCNSIQVSDSFFEGGGPWKSFSSTITGSGSAFTVNATSHGFRVGDYIVISSSTVGGYNGRWKVASVTTNSLTVTSTVTGSATATLGTLWSCGLLGGTAGGNVTESSIDNCLFNTSGSPGTGSVGLYLDGRDTTPVSGIRISQCTWDYGVTGFFAHGITNQASNVLGATVYNSNVSLIYVNACGPNGGPRDEFGAFRLEGVTSITINDCACFPTDNNPPGTGKTFNSLVISDGGQSYYTQDISITGGTYTVPYSSSLFPSASIYAFVFDGANVRRVNIAGVGVDTLYSNAYVSSFINGATVSNGIALLYSDKNGNLLFVGTNSSSGANVLASNVMGKCAYAQKSANQSIPNSSFTAVTFDNLIFDDASIWSSGANTRLTVPSNVSRVRVASNVSFASNSTGYRYVAIVKNGSSRIASQLQLADRNSQINICSPIINVAAGDYFEFFLEQNTGGALDVLATAETAFSLEIIK